jgi:hypothetical protein
MLPKDTILAGDDADEPLTEAELSLAQFLGGRPSHFTGKTPYRQVRNILRLLIARGWMENPTVWKNPGPLRNSIEYPLIDGWRLNLDIPSEVGNYRNRVPVRVEFLPPGEPSPPGTIPVAHFYSSFAPEYLGPIHRRA